MQLTPTLNYLYIIIIIDFHSLTLPKFSFIINKEFIYNQN